MENNYTGERRAQVDRRAKSDRRMLGAAISLIAAHGSKNVSMAQIGMAAGYSRGLPAERFGTKLRLLEAVVSMTEAWFNKRLQKVLEGKTGLEALSARIVAHMESVRDSSEAAIAVYHLIVEATGTVVDLKPRITKLNQSYADGMKIHMEEARAKGELKDGVDIDRHALAIVSAMHGLAIQALIRGDIGSLGLDAHYIAEIHIAAIARKKQD
ncbi:TetR family transcriptional regulator [Sneathiella chungangensis]|uniref:TetR family transcriptional regulator n=1 Tax=Sneathiella chungangensis TaxID=1418234 RepID=A0A845MFG9_9PROT|nr:TetR/AcrR family transcriptional regulator [Sneathiella chungangensis]MZR22728.1 TetR family transcriptional regulator [Sneathiella chungangensis]